MKGRYSEDYGLTISQEDSSVLPCKGCPKGRWSEITRVLKEASCISCGAGKHGHTQPGASSNISCVNCPTGTFSEAVGAYGELETCIQCPSGFAQSREGKAFW